MELKGSSVIITGGSSGMGAATAEYLVAQGANVAILDLKKSSNFFSVQCDVTSERSVLDALEKVEKKIGVPRVCVNCAGILIADRIAGRDGPMSLDSFKKCIEVNLVGTFNVMRLVATRMQTISPINEERGIIINTASIAAFEGQIGQVAYSASKGGVAAMTLPVARELAKFGIRVVAVAPGLIETPMMTELPEKAQTALNASTVFPPRLGKPLEYAKFIEQIITNPLLNGAILRLDGAVRLS